MRVGTTTDDVRRRNLSAVLRLVHRNRTATRAELTRRTGLSRSTVKALVEELVDAGLVEETQPECTNQVGRPSTLVRPRDRVVAVAVNPEVDAITVAAVALGGAVLGVERVPTTAIPTVADTVRLTARAVDTLRGRLPADSALSAIGVAVPGVVHAPESTVRLAPHLDWHDEQIGEPLRAATGLPVYAANDANVGAVAEHIFGGHPDADHMVYVNGGASGIGGAFVVAGRLLEGAEGYAGELGHTYVGGTRACHCGAVGCLETEVVPTDDLAELEQQARYLGIALGGAINLLNPRLVVLGGFLRTFSDHAAEALRAAVARQSLGAARELVRIVPASLGSETLMIGAAELAFGPLLADPAGCR
ncbi:ROK family transcriptional regulator [Mycobacterium sp. GA-2829]|uniref:ROK family transcriptional regulator n=1 Tax=Mycobacterium sp. GA-2829 TaxID=1772283 RepID=UPI00073FE1F0|nr:ROK family transcriptional regulator [Mycobacterium sp. GA-2829]KUI23691.1 ROK family transcriptional regulator [Mycobacterium sp. GA-2829]